MRFKLYSFAKQFVLTIIVVQLLLPQLFLFGIKFVTWLLKLRKKI